MKPRNPEGKPRLYGLRHRTLGVVEVSFGDYFNARRRLNPTLDVVVSYDDGKTWYEIGESPESEDPRKK